jgi:purine-nucleoside/S-methyl-5'-thioadenosine phosphorylase / adenosine deaminase
MIGWDGEHLTARLGDARVLFTTRRGGVSEGPYASLNLGERTGDDPVAVAANHERLRSLAGDVRIARCAQVHGTRVVTAGDGRPEADGIVTDVTGVAALVITADCLPVALSVPGAVAMLHAGWRGLAGGVLEQGVAALRELGATGSVTAAIGPGAGGCCYEVGDEVRDAFADVPEAIDGRNVDLKTVARARLHAAGAVEVHDAGICTICDERFFSHRRDRGITGRQGGLAWLT